MYVLRYRASIYSANGCDGTFVISHEGTGYAIQGDVAGEKNGYVLFAMGGVKIVFIRGWELGL